MSITYNPLSFDHENVALAILLYPNYNKKSQARLIEDYSLLNVDFKTIYSKYTGLARESILSSDAIVEVMETVSVNIPDQVRCQYRNFYSSFEGIVHSYYPFYIDEFKFPEQSEEDLPVITEVRIEIEIRRS